MTPIKSLLEILLVSTRLGLTSFGGPIAHLGYFREEYVSRRKWLNQRIENCSCRRSRTGHTRHGQEPYS